MTSRRAVHLRTRFNRLRGLAVPRSVALERIRKQTFANSPGPEGKYEKVVFGCARVL